MCRLSRGHEHKRQRECVYILLWTRAQKAEVMCVYSLMDIDTKGRENVYRFSDGHGHKRENICKVSHGHGHKRQKE